MLRVVFVGLMLATQMASATVLAAGQADAMCPKIGEIAELIMGHRQEGTAISDLRAALGGVDGAVNEVAMQMILDAYEKPRYSTDENKLKAKADFRNDMELMCYRTMK